MSWPRDLTVNDNSSYGDRVCRTRQHGYKDTFFLGWLTLEPPAFYDVGAYVVCFNACGLPLVTRFSARGTDLRLLHAPVEAQGVL